MKICMKTVCIIFGAAFGIMGALLAFCCAFDIYSGTYTMGTDGKLCGSICISGALITGAFYEIESLRDEVNKLNGRIDNEI